MEDTCLLLLLHHHHHQHRDRHRRSIKRDKSTIIKNPVRPKVLAPAIRKELWIFRHSVQERIALLDGPGLRRDIRST